MTSTYSRFIEPLDVLFLRGNQLFGEPGSYGEALMPPWPSVAAGALRTRILADDGIDLADFAAGRNAHPQLGTPQAPGSFALQGFQVARQTPSGAELLMPLPAFWRGVRPKLLPGSEAASAHGEPLVEHDSPE